MHDRSSPSLTATPAKLPLAGGQANASVILHPLLSAEMTGPVGWFHNTGGRLAALKALGIGVRAEQHITVPIIAFLVEHPSAGPILIDTGFHGCVADRGDPERARNLGPIGRVMARSVHMRPEQAVAAQLRARGIDPAAIALIVMTHLHFDHASALADFPGATVLVSEPEWRSARGRGGALRGYSIAQLDPRATYRTLDFAAAPAVGRGPFAQTLDVFGDGSVTLVSTPGHSLGHMSVILRLSDREALITGDAAYTMQTLRDGERPWRSEDAKAFERSIGTLRAYDLANPDTLIVPGHDMAHWRTLQARYA